MEKLYSLLSGVLPLVLSCLRADCELEKNDLFCL